MIMLAEPSVKNKPKPLMDESFRDSLYTMDETGNRKWVYPEKVSGLFAKYRHLVGYFLLAILFAIPFIEVGGEPFVLLDVLHRRFILFSYVFMPQDFDLFVIAMISMVVFIILFTIVYGRVFCGWVCPQTIFLDFIFRKIEYALEGNRTAQIRLDNSELNFDKLWRKSVKHILFIAISFVIANVLLTYIVGLRYWKNLVFDAPTLHIQGLIAMIGFTGAFYFVFSRFREQVCSSVCPYGRLQGVLLDKNSLAVSYDYSRGESRGLLRKNEDRQSLGMGDCIDCKKCIHVCPAGIDIRNGIQLECTQCTACIDACDNVMEKIGLPKGLIRYSSQNNIALGLPFQITKRVIAYTVVLGILLTGMVIFLSLRTDVELSLLRTQGTLYQKQSNNKISNLYNWKLMNKTHEEIPVQLKLENIKGELKFIGALPNLKPGISEEGAVFVILDQKDIAKMKTDIKIGVYSNGKKLEDKKVVFIGPM
jgi:cytochrome c oxidase accessory protein FixG